MGGFNPLNIDALANAPQQDVVDAQNKNAIQGIVAGGGNQPQPVAPAAAPSPVPVQQGGVRGLLTRFFQGMGASMMNSGGALDAYEKQASIQYKRAATQETQQQTLHVQAQTAATELGNKMAQRKLEVFQQMFSPAGGATGGVNDLLKPLGELNPDETALVNAGRSESLMKSDLTPLYNAVHVVTQNRAISGRLGEQGKLQSIPVTADMAQSLGLPKEMIGQKISQSQLTSISKTAQTHNLAENENAWIAKANAGDATAKGKLDVLQSRRVQLQRERGASFAQAKADNTPYAVFDANGNITTVPVSTAIKQGYPSAQVWNSILGPTGSTRSQGQAAGAVAEHIPAFQQAVRNLAAKGELGAVTGRINSYLTQGYGGDDPDIAEFVTTAGLIKTGAVRAHFGARGGAQVLGTFDKYLNTAQEPNALIGSSNALNSFLSTYKNVGTPKGPGSGPAPKGGFNWNSLPQVKQ